MPGKYFWCWKTWMTTHDVFDFKLGGEDFDLYPPGNDHISPTSRHMFKMSFLFHPFPKVGHVSFLGGYFPHMELTPLELSGDLGSAYLDGPPRDQTTSQMRWSTVAPPGSGPKGVVLGHRFHLASKIWGGVPVFCGTQCVFGDWFRFSFLEMTPGLSLHGFQSYALWQKMSMNSASWGYCNINQPMFEEWNLKMMTSFKELQPFSFRMEKSVFCTLQ